ncbi:hypothetical protein V8E54_010301 [Elaphomyces granulatus]
MSYDSDGFAIPSKPSSVRSSPTKLRFPSLPPSKEPSEFQHPLYRQLNLRANHVYLRPQDDLLPPFVSSLVARIRQTPDPRPTPSRETIQELRNLELGAPESQVVQFFRTSFFPNAPKLKRTFSLPMSKDAVPNHDASLKISTPAPDVLYGYDRSAFSDEQLIPLGTRPVANSDDVLFPFFLAELKGDSPGGDGSLFVATNQCLGGTATCLNIIARLNFSVESTVFSLAMSGTEARLYVSWKEGTDFNMAKVESFLLQKLNDYADLQQIVKNILDWGREHRLAQINENLKGTAATKSRQPSSLESGSSRKRQRVSSESRSAESPDTN